MRRLSALILLFSLLHNSFAAVKMDYAISIDTIQHYTDVTLHASNITGTSTTLKLPVWAPGYYKIMDYPVNVVDFDAQGLKVDKQGKNAWIISHPATTKEFTVTFQVYCNDQSVASAQIESQQAFLPLNGILMHVDGEKDSPVTLTINMPSNWKHITTGLDKLSANTKHQTSNTYYAPNFDKLYDSPLLLGNYDICSFDLDDHHYDFGIVTPDGIDKWPLMDDLKKVIRCITTMFGDIPYSHYAFIMLKQGQGGLEHINSQAIFTEGTYNFQTRDDYIRFLSFMTHEFFHLYNVKCIRPIEVGPFNYDAEIFSPCLWVSEGLTVYYEHVILERCGIITPAEREKAMRGYINDIESHEGQKHQSLRQFSYDIFLNFMNWGPQGLKTTVSYYEKGPVIGWLLDIDIRRATDGKKSLDDVMRLLYNHYYKELHRGFTEEELWQAITDVAGHPLNDIRTLVDTTKPIDYTSYGIQIPASH